MVVRILCEQIEHIIFGFPAVLCNPTRRTDVVDKHGHKNSGDRASRDKVILYILQAPFIRW